MLISADQTKPMIFWILKVGHLIINIGFQFSITPWLSAWISVASLKMHFWANLALKMAFLALFCLPMCQKNLGWPHIVLLAVKSVQLVQINVHLELTGVNVASYRGPKGNKKGPFWVSFWFLAIWSTKMNKHNNCQHKHTKLGAILTIWYFWNLYFL